MLQQKELLTSFNFLKIPTHDSLTTFFEYLERDDSDKSTWVFININHFIMDYVIVDGGNNGDKNFDVRTTLYDKNIPEILSKYSNKHEKLKLFAVSHLRIEDVSVIEEAFKTFGISLTNFSLEILPNEIYLKNGILYSVVNHKKPFMINELIKKTINSNCPNKVIYLTEEKQDTLMIEEYIVNHRISTKLDINHELHIVNSSKNDRRVESISCRSIVGWNNAYYLKNHLKPLQDHSLLTQENIFHTESVVSTLENLYQHLNNKKVWMVFDLDETILTTEEFPIGYNNDGLLVKEFIQRLLENDLPETLNKIHLNNNVKCFALTARNFIRTVDHTNHFVKKAGINFNIFKSYYKNDCYRLDAYQGIVYTNGSNKKNSINVLLSMMTEENIPEQIIFFEDRVLQIPIVENDIKEYNKKNGTDISFLGFAVEVNQQKKSNKSNVESRHSYLINKRNA
jgi:hypothetical protein